MSTRKASFTGSPDENSTQGTPAKCMLTTRLFQVDLGVAAGSQAWSGCEQTS